MPYEHHHHHHCHQRKKLLKACLTSQQEVPPVVSEASGEFIAKQFEKHIEYNLLTFRINDVTQAHIHAGAKGENGPIVAWLYGPTQPVAGTRPASGPVDGFLVGGIINKEQLTGPLEGQDLEALIDLIKEGRAYINVHTLAFPGGEIRGQVKLRREKKYY